MALNFLFWNVAGNDPAAQLAALVLEHNIHVLMLTEYLQDPVALQASLPPREKPWQTFRDYEGAAHIDDRRRRLTALVSLPGSARLVYSDPTRSLMMLELLPPHDVGLLLAVAHLPSRLHRSADDIGEVARHLARTVDEMERERGSTRTLVVGDLNLTPFDWGVAGAQALHAVMDRAVARRGRRTVAGKTAPFFYNPMWSLMGDRSPGPSGSYFRGHGGHVEYFWHLFDQVLVRPELMEALTDVRILDACAGHALVQANGRPDTSVSDHLPLLFRLDLARVR